MTLLRNMRRFFTGDSRENAGLHEIPREFLWATMSRVRQPVLLIVGEPFQIERMNEAAYRLFEGVSENVLTGWFTQAFSLIPGLAQRVVAAMADPSRVVIDVPITLQAVGRDELALTITVQAHPGGGEFAFVLLGLINSSLLEPGRSTRLTTLRDIFGRLEVPAWVLGPDNSLYYQNPRYMELPAHLKVNVPSFSAQEQATKDQNCRNCLDQAGERVASDPCWQMMAKHARVRGTVIERTIPDPGRGDMRVIMFPLLQNSQGIYVGCVASPYRGLSTPYTAADGAEIGTQATASAQARDAERIAIAREVHDALGQELTVLRLGLRRLHLDLSSANQLSGYFSEQFASLMSQIEQLTTSARRIAHELRHDSSPRNGFSSAASELINGFQTRSWLQGQLVVAPSWTEPSSEVAAQLYRILQEALSNIAKHAKAERFLVSLVKEGDYSTMTVQDDGVGIPAHVLQGHASPGFGLQSMTERTAGYNGEVIIRTRPIESGTLIKVRMLDLQAASTSALQ